MPLLLTWLAQRPRLRVLLSAALLFLLLRWAVDTLPPPLTALPGQPPPPSRLHHFTVSTRHEPGLYLLLESGAPAEARVFDIEDQGVIKVLALDMGETRLHATVPAGTKVARDEVIRFGWQPRKVLTFDRETGLNLGLG